MMQKWAYMGITINQDGQVANGQLAGAPFGQAASNLGNDGWELVLCFPLPNGFFEFVFKRPN
jgi:hypothetical protein